MKLLIIFFFFFFHISQGLHAQKLRYSSLNYAGITEGQSGTALQFHTINGFRHKSWFGGIGAGLDYYYQRSIPLFFSAGKFLDLGKVPLYFTGDIGVNFPWSRGIYYFENAGEYHAGVYWGSGLGYRFGFKNSNALLLNLGYNYKRLTQTYETPVACLVPPCDTYTEKYEYNLRRLSVKVGWMF